MWASSHLPNMGRRCYSHPHGAKGVNETTPNGGLGVAETTPSGYWVSRPQRNKKGKTRTKEL
jgi:hypothetical protein